MPRESRHVWVGNLPESVKDEEVAEYFSRYGRVEKIKLLPKISPDGGRAAFVDFVDIRSATKANEAQNQMGGRDLRTNYNEPGHKQQQQQQQQQQGDFERNHAMMQHRIHGGYAPAGLGYQRPVVIYAAPPPQVDHVIHAAAPYHHIYQRDERRPPYQPKRERGRSPGSRGSASDGDRSPSPGRRAGYSSGSDTNEKNDKCTVLLKNLYAMGTSDTSLEEALYHEFKKYGEILNINIKGNGMDRYAYVQFSKPEEAENSTRSSGKLFLGQDLKVVIKSTVQRSGVIPLEDLAFDPHATRTVFVGNLDKAMMHGELRNIFERFGEVVDVDIKKMAQGITTYAFVQFIDINGATLAKRKMDRQAVGNNRIKVGYGRGTPTNSLWVGNLPPNKVAEHDIVKYFQPFGLVQRVLIDRKVWQALIRFETIEACTKAFAEMHGQSFMGKRIAVDYASPACRNAFYSRMERHGFLDRRQLEPSPTPPDSHINFQNAARGGPFQPRGGFGSIQQREEHRSERYSDRFERDGRDSRNRDRSRGYSPMSRSSMSPKRAGAPKESVSPVRSDRTDSRNKRRHSVGSPVPDQEPAKKKEKKKKKDKKEKKKAKAAKGTMELGYDMHEEPPAPPVQKTREELKKEKKEKRKAEKARKKAERKEKKLRKMKDLQDKLSSIKAAVNKEEANDGKIKYNYTENGNDNVEENSQLSSSNETETGKMTTPLEAVSEVSEGEGPMQTISTNEIEMREETPRSPINNDKERAEASYQSPPASPDQEKEVAEQENDRKVGGKPQQTPPSNDDSSDSSSSSSSSSDSDDSDDSSDDDRKTAKRASRKTVKERDAVSKRRSIDSDEKPPTENVRREPKAYRQDRGEPEVDYQRRDRSKDSSYADREREREREREEYRMKQHEYHRSSSNKESHRSKSPSSYRPGSRSRSPYKRDERSPYDRKRGRSPQKRSPRYEQRKSSYDSRNEKYPQKEPPPPPPSKDNRKQCPPGVNQNAPGSQSTDTLLDLLRRFPVMWQGLLGLKNDTAAVQMHFLSGDVRLAETSLPRSAQPHEVPPPLRVSQRMKLEPSQLEEVDKRIQSPKEHCMLLALPCGRDPLDVHAQTRALKNGFITYLQQKQAAGIVNVPNPSTKQPVCVIHIFPPCEFAQGHLIRVAPDLLDSAVESGHLMVLITPI